MSRTTSCAIYLGLLCGGLCALPCSGNDVLEAARRHADGGGYRWVAGNSGTPIAIEFDDRQILAKGEGTYCCGFTLAVAFEVASERGLLKGKDYDALRTFQKQWYGATEASGETQCVYAAKELGIGHAVPLDEAQPGDFVQLWRTSGSGHSVVLLQMITDGDKIVGLNYRSSQKSTDGIGDREEYFSDVSAHKGSVVRERTYVCRLNEPELTKRNTDLERASAMVADGQFAQAETILKQHAGDPNLPVSSGPALELEILRRVRRDFSLTTDEVLAQIRESVPDATLADLMRWRDAGDVHYRIIDGEPRYFNRAASNLFRFNPQARSMRKPTADEPRFDITTHVAELVDLAAKTGEPSVYPVMHKIHYELTIKKDHPRLKPGAVVRVWLPFPQEYRQQEQVRLSKSEPPHKSLAENLSPHRTVYFEQTVSDPLRAPRFAIEFEYVSSAWCPDLDPEKVEPYDRTSEPYREFTAERAPHIVFTPEVQRLAKEIVGEEKNPLTKARLIFRWVSANVPWCAEMEYSIIDSLSAKGLAARRGDCGVQGMVFITLCRAAGIPARWQSGFQTKPGNWNMHDWSEFYVEPWGWLPADASYGVLEHEDPQVRDFFCGHLDPYRLVVNLDYGRALKPKKVSFRSEPNDFQRGEVEIDGHNLYFDEWDWSFRVETEKVR